MKNYHAYKNEQKMIIYGDGGMSDREYVRKMKKVLEVFSRRITDDKLWWMSLSYEDQSEILRTWNSKDIKDSKYNIKHIFKTFINESKIKFPGNLSKRRDIILEEILK